MSDEILKRWVPGSVELNSYVVFYEKNGEKLGMYVMASDESDAKRQVLSRESEAKVQEVELQVPILEHEILMRLGK